MEHHVHNGTAPSHGFKVGIGSLASVALYEDLLDGSLAALDVEAAVSAWPTPEQIETEIATLFDVEEIAAKAREESLAKHPGPTELSEQLNMLRSNWPELATRLRAQLIPLPELRDMLHAAGAPSRSGQIGIAAGRLENSYRKAYHIRRRFTVLDLARRTGLLDAALGRILPSSTGGEAR
jgi:glycerol-1-phosphate dehydrogenase [NAD(P)+]